MGKSKIEWTDAVWNPVVGCEKVSEACKNCYAIGMAHRLAGIEHSAKKYEGITKKTEGGRINFTGKVRLDEASLLKPFQWKKGKKIFANSMGDLFHKDVPFEWIDKVFAVMALCPHHTFQILTKRPERMREYFESRVSNFNQPIEDCILEIVRKDDIVFENNKNNAWVSLFKEWVDEGGQKAYCTLSTDAMPNVWLGATVENQKTANERIPHLLACPAKVRFLSCEPLLEAIDLNGIFEDFCDGGKMSYIYPLKGYRHTTQTIKNTTIPKIDWVIVGGESGRGARPTHPDWVRSIRDQCKEAGVPFFFKQWGEWLPADGRRLYQYKRIDIDFETCMLKVGKHASGRLIDGQEHNEMPQP